MNSGPPRPGPLLVDVAGRSLTAADEQILAHPAVGGAILFTRNYTDREQLAELTAAMRAVRPNLLIAADQEGGRVQRFRDGFSKIVPMRALGRYAAHDAEAARHAAREIGWLLAVELARVGVALPLAPVVDLDYGASTIIGDRAFAPDSQSTTELARAFMAGLEQAGSAATAKHFPGHGFVAADSHTELPVDAREWSALAPDIAPYRALIGEAVGGARGPALASIMMAHVRYPRIDGLPASLSRYWIGDILRGVLGFDGCVFCDDLSMHGAAVVGDYGQRARLALEAGCDYLPVCNNRDAVVVLLDTVACDDESSCARRERLARACDRPLSGRATALECDPRWRSAVALNRWLFDHYNPG